MASPGKGISLPGLSFVHSIRQEACKPNSVVCGHSSRRRVAADTHQRPTRRFRPLHGAALRHRAGTARESCSGLAHSSLFGLAPCGVYPACGVTVAAVRSYRTFSPLPRRDWPSRRTWSHSGSPRFPKERGVAEAVCFLWHWPSTGLDARVPDVIRHTALRSSDFPPPAIRLPGLRQRPPGAPARV